MPGIDCGQLSIDQLHYGVPSKWDSGPANISEFISVKGSIANALKALFGLCLPLEYLCPGSSADRSGTTGRGRRPEWNEFTNCIYCVFTESFSTELQVLIAGVRAAVHEPCSDSTWPVQHNIREPASKLRQHAATLLHITKRVHEEPRTLSTGDAHARTYSAAPVMRYYFVMMCTLGDKMYRPHRRGISSKPDSVRGWCFPQGYTRRWGATHPGRWREHGCHVTNDTKSSSLAFFSPLLPWLLTAIFVGTFPFQIYVVPHPHPKGNRDLVQIFFLSCMESCLTVLWNIKINEYINTFEELYL